jgi:hypothetical protein
MFSCLTEYGRLGLTAVGDTAEDAWRIYQAAQAALLEDAGQAMAEGPIVG